MKDPRRLIEGDDLSDVERRVLAAARRERPPESAVNEVWAALAPLPPGGGPGGAAPASGGGAGVIGAGGTTVATGSAAGGAFALVKSAALGLALGTLVTGGATTAWHFAKPEAQAVASVDAPARGPSSGARPRGPAISERTAATETLPAPGAEPAEQAPRSSLEEARAPSLGAAEDPTPAPRRESTTSIAPSRGREGSPSYDDVIGAPGPGSSIAAFERTPAAPAPTTVPTRAEPPGSVGSPAAEAARQETHLVTVAREALRGGDVARAVGALEEARRLFPAGVVQQEREALAIEALVRLGHGDAAEARARAFLRAYPTSPHVARVRALVPGL